jgi:hypothetical protein
MLRSSTTVEEGAVVAIAIAVASNSASLVNEVIDSIPVIQHIVNMNTEIPKGNSEEEEEEESNEKQAVWQPAPEMKM